MEGKVANQPDSSDRQEQDRFEWANAVLRDHRKPFEVTHTSQLRDGRIFAAIIECFSRTKVCPIFSQPFSQSQKLHNLGSVLRFLGDKDASLKNVPPKDVVQGDSNAIFAILKGLEKIFLDSQPQTSGSRTARRQSFNVGATAAKSRPPVPIRKSSLERPPVAPSAGLGTRMPRRTPSFVASAKEAFEAMAMTRSTSTEHLRSLIRSGGQRRRSSSSSSIDIPSGETTTTTTTTTKTVERKISQKPIPAPKPSKTPKATTKVDVKTEEAGTDKEKGDDSSSKDGLLSASDKTYESSLLVARSGIPQVSHQPLLVEDESLKSAGSKQDHHTSRPNPPQTVENDPSLLHHKENKRLGILPPPDVRDSSAEKSPVSVLDVDGAAGPTATSLWSRSSSVVTVLSAAEKSGTESEDVRKVETISKTVEKEDEPQNAVAVDAAERSIIKSSSGVSTASSSDQQEMFTSIRRTVNGLLGDGFDELTTPSWIGGDQSKQSPSPPASNMPKTTTSLDAVVLRKTKERWEENVSGSFDRRRASLGSFPPSTGILQKHSPPPAVLRRNENSLSSASIFSEETASIASGDDSSWHIAGASDYDAPRGGGGGGSVKIRRCKSFTTARRRQTSRRNSLLQENVEEASSLLSLADSDVGSGARRCQTPAEANLIIRRLRRELESAQTIASSVAQELKSQNERNVMCETRLEKLQLELDSVVEDSRSKDNEIVGLRKTLEALREEADEKVDPSSNTSSPHVIIQTRHESTGSESPRVGGVGSYQHRNKLPPPYPDFRVTSEEGEIRVSEGDESGKSPKKKRKRGFFRRKKSSTSSMVSVDSLKNSSRETEDKVFSGVSHLEGQLMDSQAEIARLTMSNESALHETDDLKHTVKTLESQLSSLLAEPSPTLRRRQTSNQDTRAGSLSPVLTPCPSPLPDFLADDDDDMLEGRKVTLYLHVGDGHRDRQVVAIANMNVPLSVTWDVTDLKIMSIFQRYLTKIDGDSCLGLDKYSISYYWLGDVRRVIGSKCPERASPHQATMMDRPAAVVHLRSFDEGCCDALAFQTLIPKTFIRSYTSVLLTHRQVLIVGPQSSGKSFLASRLATYCLQRKGVHVPNDAIVTVPMDALYKEKAHQVLKDVLTQVYQRKISTNAIILENVASFEHLAEITACIPPSNGITLFIIATMSMQLHAGSLSVLSSQLWSWRQIQLWWHCDPIYGLLKRSVKRRFVEAHTRTGKFGMHMMDVTRWVMRVWYRLNTVLESFCSIGTGLGPGRFMECPLNIRDLEMWFVLLWNHTLLPYLTTVLRNCRLPKVEKDFEWGDDPIGWILHSCPFKLDSPECPPLMELNARQLGIHNDIICSSSAKEGHSTKVNRPTHDHMINLLSHLVSSPLLPSAPRRKKSSDLSFAASEKQREAEEAARRVGIPQDIVQSLL
ncbi:neuron navigator 2-like isoform X2 [Oscarella lobularis]|uniref:neuron navigator 2-like isoform X2 n=1 Tax=Oscarella lobularis TaxID=121494 RepID=UPI003314221F